MAQGEPVVTNEERHKYFFEADEKRRKAVCELERLRRKGRAVAQLCDDIRAVFSRTNPEDMANDWMARLRFIRERNNPWPDTGEESPNNLVRTIEQAVRDELQAEQEMNRLRGLP